MAIITAKEFIKGGKPRLVQSSSTTPTQSEEKTKSGFLSNVKQDLAKRGSNVKASVQRAASGKQNPLSSGIQLVGQGIGAATDILSRGVGATAKAVAPQSLEDALGRGVQRVGESKVGQFAGDIAERYQSWKAKNPEAAANLEGVVNIASLIPIGKGAQVTGKGVAAVGKGTKALTREGGDLLGKGLIKTGEKIQETVLKPQRVDIKNGFKIENMTKYGLNGPLDQSFNKTSAKLKSLKNELQEIVKSNADAPTLNLSNVLDQVETDFKGKGLKNLGSQKSITKTINDIRAELDEIVPDWKSKTINFSDAIDTKRAAGLNASFLHGQMKQGLSVDEKVWNNFYRILQKETEKSAKGTRFAEINKQISEIIPIEQAIIRRIPVAERNNLISLPELVAYSFGSVEPTAFTFGVLHRLLRSGTAAKGAIKAGKALKKR